MAKAGAIFDEGGNQTGWAVNAMYILDDGEIAVIFVEIAAGTQFVEEVVEEATADVTFVLTTPAADENNTITGGGDTETVAVAVANNTSSVVITGTKTAAQTVVVGGTDGSDVTAGGTDTAPTYTVDTSAVATAGGSKTFTLTVSEDGKTDIAYTVTVTVATP